ncbi:MAG: Gfo/Idh/MocA family oxidoreductase, partial [Pirellulales bacterium]|nr:Gfo/Idh/MocA family oxidoreductase [Pirellulales bacterium]
MARKINRRSFVQKTSVAAAGYWVAGGVSAAESKSANEKVQFACIGIGGKGSSDSADAGKNGDVVGICDTDAKRLKGAAKRFKGASSFADYREMLDSLGDKIDAVTVSTPDHTHAVAAAKAMSMGKHCFCQKPLTHTIYEARYLGELAKKMGVATEMGNQGTSNNGLREAAAITQSGGIGDVTEVHVWTNRPIWPQGGPRPESKPEPESLSWDAWLGPAPERPYANGYHPFAWRGWWDFGTGALGDMACHTFNMPFAALN